MNRASQMPTTRWFVVSSSIEDTQKWGRLVGCELKLGDVVVLLASLGGGKTTFVQGLVRGLGIKDEALSPTFIVAQTLEGKCRVHHMDFYRLSSAELLAMGVQDYLSGRGEVKPGIVLIEWAERCKKIWPKERLEVRIKILADPKRRKIEFVGIGERFSRLVQKLKI